MSKRFLCMLMAALCLGTALSAKALSAPLEVPAAMAPGASVLGACEYQGALLIRTSDGLYSYREDAPTQLLQRLPEPMFGESPNFAMLLSQGERLYGYDPLPGRLYPLSLDGGLTIADALSLDLADYGMSDGSLTYIPPPNQALLHEGRVYLLFHTSPNGAQESRLVSFDLQGQDRRDYAIDNLRGITPYKDGTVLCLVEEKPGLQSPGALQVFHPADGSLTDRQALQQHYHFGSDGLLWDEEHDLVYYQSRDRLYARNSQGQESLRAHLGDARLAGNAMVLLRPGLAAFPHALGVSIRQTVPPQLESRTLTIRGGYGDDSHQRAARLMPDVRIEFVDSFGAAQGLSEALVLGDATFDLYALSPQQMDTLSLMKKGYAASLADSAVILEHMRQLPPQAVQAAALEDSPFLLPVSVTLDPLYANLPAFKEAGLRVPASLEALLAMMTDHKDDLPLFEQPPTREQLVVMACRLWTARARRMGQQPVFDHPDFLRVLTAITQVPAVAALPDDTPPNRALFPTGNELKLDAWTNDCTWHSAMAPLFLSFLEGEAPLPLMRVQLLAINPRTHYPEAALQYLESMVQSLSPLERAALYPQAGMPLEDPAFPRTMARMQAYLHALEENAEKVEGPEKTELERQAREVRHSMSANADKNKWLVSAEVLAQYQQLLDAAVLEDRSFALVFEAGAAMVFSRAIQGSLTTQQAARELDERLGLMRAEGQ